MRPSRFHLPVPLGSTVVTRFLATTGTLTPALLRPAPGQVSLITERAFPDIPSPPTRCAPDFRPCFLFRSGLAPDSLCVAIGGSSDFAHCSQSHQSHQAVSSLCRGRTAPVSSTDYPFVSSCSPQRVAGLQLLSTRGGKHRHRGTCTLQCTLSLKRTNAAFMRQNGVPEEICRAPPPPSANSAIRCLQLKGSWLFSPVLGLPDRAMAKDT